MTQEVLHYINGKQISSHTKKLEIFNPSLGQCIRHLHVADAALVDNAVTAASTAFKHWSQTTLAQRTKILFNFKSLLDKNSQELAALIHEEHGKSIEESLGSLQRGIDVVDYACGIATHLKGDYTTAAAQGIDVYSMRQPLGVCVGITPFNFPGMIPLWMFPMAIACGNTFILKPSEKDPSCAARLVELATEAGVPAGVVNVVHGDSETVDALITHPDVKAVSFVGSSLVAEQVYKKAIYHNKRAQAFGGAKNHCIVMPDADMKIAADNLVTAAYGSCGERCMAISVVVAVGDKTADKLIAEMQPIIQKFRVGPLITSAHYERVQSYVALGESEGATLIIDNSKLKPSESQDGFYMGACLFDNVLPAMRIYREEIFGPVLCIVRVNDFAAALQLVNEHAYGNGTAIFTRDGHTAHEFAEKVQVGMVGINVPVPVPVAYHSFGGWKNSIFSDIGMYGSEAIRFYTKLKTVTQRWYP